MPAQKRFAQLSLAKQTAKGAAAATGTYQIGVSGGNVVQAEVSEDALDATWSTRLIEAFDRTGVTPMAEFDFVAMPKSLGLFLYGACGSLVTTGAGPYTHTFTPGTALPYFTLFALRATSSGTSYYKITDCAVDELELSWDQVGAVKAKAKVLGLDLTFPGSPYTPGTDERPNAGLLKGHGGTFQIDGANAVIKSGSIKFSNSVEPVFGSAAVQPVDVFPASHQVDVSLSVIPDDYLLWRKRLTGTTGGSTAQAIVQYGTAQTKFILDANTDLDITLNRLKFATDSPDSDPSGGPVEVALEGSLAAPTSGNAYTALLRNNVASY